MTGENLDKFSQLITTALGLVAALAWMMPSRPCFSRSLILGTAGGPLAGNLFYAVLVTLALMMVLIHKQMVRLRTPHSLRRHRLAPRSPSA